MRLNDLFEGYNLPLLGNEIPKARGSYGAFLISISAEDFLRITTNDQESIDQIKSKPFPQSKEEFIDWRGEDGANEYDKYNIPFLKVVIPSGKIIGHEGRHRAAMVLKKGGTNIPVILYPYENSGYAGSYRYRDDTGYTRKSNTKELYSSEEEAEAAAEKELLAYPEDDRLDSGSEYISYSQLKGEPSRSDYENWQHAAWKPEDCPKTLIGQFNNETATGFRVGLVKGYRHHKL